MSPDMAGDMSTATFDLLATEGRSVSQAKPAYAEAN